MRLLSVHYNGCLCCSFVTQISTYFSGRYKRKKDQLIELVGAAQIPTTWGTFKAYCYKSLLDGIEHVAMVKVTMHVFIGFILNHM